MLTSTHNALRSDQPVDQLQTTVMRAELAAMIDRITVTDGGVPIKYLNELEWIKGEIFANVYTTDYIARIDPSTGRVAGWIDIRGLLPRQNDGNTVPNGIAYDAEHDRLFVTGKNWPRLFEIRLKWNAWDCDGPAVTPAPLPTRIDPSFEDLRFVKVDRQRTLTFAQDQYPTYIPQGVYMNFYVDGVQFAPGVVNIQAKLNTVKLLLDAGADPNRQYHHGRTALISAVADGGCLQVHPDCEERLQVIELLIKQGARTDIRDRMLGKTALEYADRLGPSDPYLARKKTILSETR